MAVESVTYINDLEPDNPKGSDRISQGDDHIRNIKKSIKQTFPNIDGEVSATDEEINGLVGLNGPIKGELEDHEARISSNEQGISALEQSKADKTYVDQQNAAQDAVIATKADKTYVDSQDGAIIARLAELEEFVSKGGGSMIKPVAQPASVGQFTIKQGSYSKPATDDIYYAAPVSGNKTVTFTVPAGKVFVMDYLFALGYVDIGLGSIKIDGTTMMPGVSGAMTFDSPFDEDFDFAAWPTPFSGASIRVEQSVEFAYYDRNVAGDVPEVCISGLFVEA